MTEIIAITNQKGGVGKTTTAYNLAASLAHYNKRVLLVDMDPQGNCSQALGIDPTLSKRTMSELLLGKSDLHHCIRKTNFDNISILSANLTLAMVESNLLTQGKSSTKLLREILSRKEINLFDYVLIDTPPSLGFLSLNALNAADSILVPVQCEYFALDALAQLLSTLYNVQEKDNRSLKILGILITMYDPRTKLSLDITKEIRNNFKDHVFLTSIPRNVSIPEAIAKGMPVSYFRPQSAGSLSYLALAREVIERVSNKNKGKQN